MGDAFAKPMLRTLEANPGRWDILRLFLITSPGVMCSEPSKQAIIERLPHLMIIDVFSIPDDTCGEAVTAVMEPAPGSTPDEAALIEHVKDHPAHYQAAKREVPIDTLGRAPNGKVDDKRLRGYAAYQLGVPIP